MALFQASLNTVGVCNIKLELAVRDDHKVLDGISRLEVVPLDTTRGFLFFAHGDGGGSLSTKRAVTSYNSIAFLAV